MRSFALFAPLLLSVFLTIGCGKYAPPVAPELAAPKGVQFEKIEIVGNELLLKWSSPSEDRRGEELSSLIGYSLQIRGLDQKVEVGDDSLGFTEIKFISDSSIAVRDAAREKARAEGRPARREKGDAQSRTHSVLVKIEEISPPALLRVVPVNSYGDGEALRVLRISKRDSQFAVQVIPLAMTIDNSEDFDGFDSTGEE